MEIKAAAEQYYRDGYVLIEDCIPGELLEHAREIMATSLVRLLKKDLPLRDGILEAIEIYRQFDVQHYLHQELQAKGVKRKLLLHDEILHHIIHFVGPDLAYNRSGAIILNIHSVVDGLYQKKWHQEVWSGACVNEIRAWLPLVMKPNTGGVEFIPGSHQWGLVPNQNREPTVFPDDFTVVAPEVKEGAIIFFHPLTLHRTIPNSEKVPRIGLTIGVRNIYYPFTGQNYLQSWQPFHFSAVGRVQQALGNPYLTPFRTLGGSLSHVRPDDGKKDIEGILE
ncbi:MAG TPA: hypothetical protein EYN18_01950 [Nitrospirales bacterium]|nr:hypothetical protein [Nitrospirales bacterium]HIB54573.1 hypothetical protein [Nitrospirales bacterium]HIC05233.1 hypothetical protein [Nitrospirales bacterium]HIO21146.1 hypothetical protein [Nitrospirales bacterium]HIO70066.1 hypothetical protein [Nitrospirales bacterium]